MKKKFTFLMAAIMLLTMFASPMKGWGQTTIYSQSGGGTVTGWTFQNNVTTNAINQTSYWLLDAGNPSDYIQTSTYDLSSYTSASLSLNAATYGSGSNPTAVVQVSFDGGSTFSNLTLSGTQPTDKNYKTLTASITSGLTSNVVIKYSNGATSGRGLRLQQLILTASSSSASTYTVTYDANGATSGDVPTDSNSPYNNGATVTVLGNTGSLAKTGYSFNNWNTSADGSGASYVAGNTFTISSNTTLFAQWTATHNITMPSADTYGSYSASATENVPYGTTVTLTYTPASGYSTYSANWSVNGTPIDVNTFSMPDEDVTVTVSVTNRITDVLNRELTGVSSGSTTYTSWSNKTSNSEAVYAGKTAGNNNSIQMNATSGNGIITTTSGGKVKSISVEWESHTQDGRYITIYGSENALTLSTITSGTSLGTIKCGTNTSITVNDNYNHIGIVANNALYLSAINITWQPSSVANPSFSPVAGTYTSAQDVTISCETIGAAIYYTTNDATPTSSSTPYSAAIHITEPTTIKAIAIKNDESSSVVSATYNIVTPLTTMDEILARATDIGTETPEDVYVTLNNWVVTGVGGYSNRNAYVTDNAGKGFIVYNNSHGFAVNDKLNGTVKAALQLYNGSSEFTTLTTSTDNISVSHDGTVTVYTKTIDQLSAVNTGSIVTIKDLTYDEDNEVLTDGTNTIIPYTTIWNGASFTDGKKYHVTGLFVQNGDNKRINPRSAADIVLAADMSETDFSGLTTFTYIVDNGPSAAQKIEVLCDDLGTNTLRATASAKYEVCSTADGTYAEYVDMTPSDGAVTADLYVRLKSGLNVSTEHTGTLTFTATNLTDIEQALTGTVSATVTYNIIVDDDIANGSIESDKDVAEEGETVTLTAHPDQYYQLGEWSVTDGYNDIDVENNQFEMPASEVMVSATFTRIQYTIMYSVNGNTEAIAAGTFNAGEVANLPEATIAGQTFLGWSNSESSTEVVKNYIPTANAMLYAVFGDLIEGDLTITKDTENFPTSYADWADVNLDGKNFKIKQAYINGGKLQWKASQGTIYNTEDFGRITSIVLVYNSSDNNKNFTIKAGTKENPTGGTAIEPTNTNLTYTFNLSTGTYNYFVMTNGTNAGYLDQIVINYEVSYPFTELTTVTGTSSISSIASTERVVVTNNGVLTLTGTNNGTAANLIIEDGGQLIVNNSGVKATVKKALPEAAKSKDENWTTIASPVKNISIGDTDEDGNVTHLKDVAYALYRLNETTSEWENYKNTDYHDGLNNDDFETFEAGRGYLYSRISLTTLEYVGEVNGDEYTEYTLTMSGNKISGFHLIGNPYSHDIYKGAKGKGCAISNTSDDDTYVLATGFYQLKNGTSWLPKLDDGTKIEKGEGILVQATTAGTLRIYNSATAPAKSNTINHDNIMFTVVNGQHEDVAYAMFDKGIGLSKINHRDNVTPMIYIEQKGEDYAIATMSDDTKSFNLNFKAMTTGQYTLSYKANGDFNYLHVIDRLTGEDVDMLLEGEYKFIGTPSDKDNRFIVKLGYMPDYSDADNEIFAYQSGSDILVSGTGELQIFDVTGRQVMTTTINGAESISVPAQGVYIFRLVGNEIKTQKIVVR